MPGRPSVELAGYLELAERVNAVSGPLGVQEADEIRPALAELDDWLLRAG
jgi:hypothetical protein